MQKIKLQISRKSHRTGDRVKCAFCFAFILAIGMLAEQNANCDDAAATPKGETGATAVPTADLKAEPEITPGSPAVGDSNAKFFLAFLADETTKEPKPMILQDRDGLAVLDGDIVLGTVEELSHAGSGKAIQYTKSVLWKKGRIPYNIPTGFVKKDVIEAAIGDFNTKTNVRFEPRSSNDQDYLDFEYTDNPNIGGQSYYGETGGRQSVWLNRDPNKWNKGVLEHELCHALGLAHEQLRSDRDRFVTIHWDHIMPGYESQFQQLGKLGKDIGNYNYDSILHYPRWAFSKDGQDTITSVKAGAAFGQMNALSRGDIDAINQLYPSVGGQ